MDENEVFENHHFVMIKRLMMTVCIWPYQDRLLKFYGRSFIIVAIHTMMIPMLIKLYLEWYEDDPNVQILAENFTGFLYLQAVLSKLFMSMYTEKKLQHLYEMMTNDYKDIQEPGERAAMDELWSFARILCIMYVSYTLTSLFFLVFTPQVVPAILDIIIPLNESRPKMICYYAEYFIDQEKYLIPLVCHTFVCVAIAILIISAVDTSYIIVSYHVLGLFNILTYRLKRVSESAKEDDIHVDDVELHNFVINTVKLHNKTLKFAELVRATYNEGHFFVFAMAVMGLAIGTIDLMANLTNAEVILRIGFVWVGLIGYLFFVNWPGQRFIDSGENLSYACTWYKLPMRTQFLMRFMMMRCLIPCQLTAGPLIQLNFANCGLILRTAMSYFTAMTSLS